MGRRRFLDGHLGTGGKEQLSSSHLHLVVEARRFVAAKRYFSVDQAVIIRTCLLQGGSGYGAVAQSQLQCDVFSGPPDGVDNAPDFHPLAVLRAAQQRRHGYSRRGGRQKGFANQLDTAGFDHRTIGPSRTYARYFDPVARLERNRGGRRKFDKDGA